MELPCTLAFSYNPSELLKVKRIMVTISIQLQPKQASLQVMNQCRNAVSQIPLSNQPLSQECEDPVEAMELDATEQHAKLWIKI